MTDTFTLAADGVVVTRSRLFGRDDRLTPRQHEALAAYALTGSWKQVAHQLGLGLATLKSMTTIIYRALGVSGAIPAFREVGWLVGP